MQYRELGKTGIQISEISFGAWAIGGPFGFPGRPIGWGPVDDADSLKALARAFELGVNFVDTADIYGFGHSEEIVGKAIRQSGKDIFVASKVGFLRQPVNGSIQDFSENHICQSCEESLRRLGRDCIDLYQLHCVPLDIIQKGDVFAALDRLQRQGKIRAYGVSIITDEEAIAALQYPGMQSIQIIFSVLRQKPAMTVFPLAKKKKVGILARVPLASGLLTGKFNAQSVFDADDHRNIPIPGETFSGVDFSLGLSLVEQLRPLAKNEGLSLAQLALRWILQNDAVTAAIPGARSGAQIEENVSAGTAKIGSSTMQKIQNIYTAQVAETIESLY